MFSVFDVVLDTISERAKVRPRLRLKLRKESDLCSCLRVDSINFKCAQAWSNRESGDSCLEAPFVVFCHGSIRNQIDDFFLTVFKHLVIL